MSTSPAMSALSAKIAQLSPRERLLLGVMVAWLSIGATLVVIWVAVGSMRELSQGNDDRRAAMLELLAQRTTFAQQKAASQELAERLSNNELRLSSFIESAATRAGLPAPTDFNDRQTPREGGITAFETTARFQGIELADFDRLMNELRSSEELVYIQHVSLEPGRGRSASQLVAEVTLVTYRRQAGGSRD